MDKKLFETPNLEIKELEIMDVITTSGDFGGGRV